MEATSRNTAGRTDTTSKTCFVEGLVPNKTAAFLTGEERTISLGLKPDTTHQAPVNAGAPPLGGQSAQPCS